MVPRAASPTAARIGQNCIRGSCWQLPSQCGQEPPFPCPPDGSDRDQLTVLAPDSAQSVADLADRCVCLDRIDDRNHEVLVAPGGVLEADQSRRPNHLVTLSSDLPDSLDLTPLAFRVDALQRWGRGFLGSALVDTDNDLDSALDSPLHLVRGLLDLSLLVPGLEGRKSATQRFDLTQIGRAH